MSFQKTLLWGFCAGLLAAITALTYRKFYGDALGVNFETIAGPIGIALGSLLGTMIAAVGHWLILTNVKKNGSLVFHLAFFLISFSSVIYVFAYKLPLDIEMPELFPGLFAPLHFFPLMAWYTVKPLFSNEK